MSHNINTRLVNGALVGIHSLESAAAEQYNGQDGVLQTFDTHAGRWAVLVSESKNIIRCRPDNIEFLSAPRPGRAAASRKSSASVQDHDDRTSYENAFSTLAFKSAPAGFDTAEAAEAAGYTWSAADGLWKKSQSEHIMLKEWEKLARSLTKELVAEMNVKELRLNYNKLREVCPSDVDFVLDEELKDEVLRMSTLLYTKTRSLRKDPMSPANNTSMPTISAAACRACGNFPLPGKKLLLCAACKSVSYCNAACQKGNWKAHKATCKSFALNPDNYSQEDFQKVMSWYSSVPDLAPQVMALAWKHRSEHPVIRVQGGVNSRQVLKSHTYNVHVCRM